MHTDNLSVDEKTNAFTLLRRAKKSVTKRGDNVTADINILKHYFVTFMFVFSI